MYKIALIGYGTIAGYVYEKLSANPDVDIVAVICRDGREDAVRKAFGDAVMAVSNSSRLPADVRLVVDCAGHEGLRMHGPAVLNAGIDLLTVSNGALADAKRLLDLEVAAKAGGASLTLSAGAVGAMDALSAAAAGGLSKVTYTGIKPCKGWQGTAAEEILNLNEIAEPSEHFRGNARDAALRYPKNANVAATIALAGIGMDDTEVVLIADPIGSKNIHQIDAEGAFGKFTFTVEGNPLPSNPKSSALTAMAVVNAVLQNIKPIRF